MNDPSTPITVSQNIEHEKLAVCLTKMGDNYPTATPVEGSYATTSTHMEDDGKAQSSSPKTEIIIKIVSAEYGPCEGIRLLNGELVNDESVRIPVTRDVAPFLRALLIARQPGHQQEERRHHSKVENDESVVRVLPPLESSSETAEPNYIHLLGTGSMNSMNTIFGDPCPGSSKRLDLHYILTEASTEDDFHTRAAKTEVHRVRFAEHDKVVLRRRLTFYQDDSKMKEVAMRYADKMQQKLRQKASNEFPNKVASSPNISGAITPSRETTQVQIPGSSDGNDAVEGGKGGNEDDSDRKLLRSLRQMGRSQSISEFMCLKSSNMSEADNLPSLPIHVPDTAVDPPRREQYPLNENLNSSLPSTCSSSVSTDNAVPTRWRLRSAVSEICLPLVLPFLEVRERVQCRLICRSWKHVVRDWGIATKIDSNDPSITNFTRPFLRGMMRHSHSSLHSLLLSGLETLTKEDLHPAIPHLRKLRSFDVSRCVNLDDSTMLLLAQSHTRQTLEVLYIKGLRNVTDAGIQSICQSCAKLEVLDLSNVPITDVGGMAIQQLIRLKALYLRDNYHLTNQSIDVITEKCTRLTQLTLWGCTRVRHMIFDTKSVPPSSSSFSTAGTKLIFLNLWGCHGLRDEVANSMSSMSNLRSLIASECHRLTDQFVMKVSESLPRLQHLHLRYCKRITDVGINSIASNLPNLYSLDLSFCSRITTSGIYDLLVRRHDSLSELRLRNCCLLNIFSSDDESGVVRMRGIADVGTTTRTRVASNHNGTGRLGTGRADDGSGSAGRQILNGIRAHGSDNCLCVLDVRECGSMPTRHQKYPESDHFVRGMSELRYEQRVPGFFSRPAQWNTIVQRRLVEQISDIGALHN